IYDANAIADGYIFLSVSTDVAGVGYYVMILDNDGTVFWSKELPDDYSYDFKVLPNGHLHYAQFIHHHTYTGGGDAVHIILDENFNEVETIEAGNGYVAEAHDFQMLPNGYALLIGYYMSEVDMSQIVNGGHPAALVSGAIVQELDSQRNVVFQWRTWDNYAFEDYSFGSGSTGKTVSAFNFNTINQDHDGQLFTSGIRKINRQTGEIIYNLGGGDNEFTFAGADANVGHFTGHGFHRIENGNVLNYDNGPQPGGTSRAHEYALDEENKIATHVWTYTPVPDIGAWHRGNAKRLPNGNTFIGWGGASGDPIPTCTEVTPDGNVVFEVYFDDPNVESYRAFRFPYPPQSQAIEYTVYELATGNDYDFGDTGVNIDVISGGGGYNEVAATREPYAPVYPVFNGKAPRVLPVRVKLEEYEITSMTAYLSFDATGPNSFDFIDNPCFGEPCDLTIYFRMPGQSLFIPLATDYNPVKEQLRATMTQFGEFIFCYDDIEDVNNAPMLIEPESDRGVQEYMVIARPLADPCVVYTVNQELPISLSWTPKGFAQWHHLQVATDADFTALVVNSSRMTEARYTWSSANPNTTYYWQAYITNNGGNSAWSTGSFATVPPMVEVTAPNGGENWQRGQDYFIKWNDNIAEDVVIELYKDDTLVETLGTVPSDRAHEWEVGLALEPGCDYSIKVKSSTNGAL
ncbi:MAG: aryl-sulfate sulfotransferase, partial [Gammaproteobacteria bacterium]